MFLSIDKQAVKPVYQQIRDEIAALIRTGTLAPGDKLPGTRELATQMGVSRKTVLNAYLELAADGWVETRPGSSTYVLDRSGSQHIHYRRAPLELVNTGNAGEPGLAADSGLPAVEDMDWSPYEIGGDYFRMPPYREKWQGQDEWISFSRAIPDVRLFPFERIKKVSSQMLWDPKAYFFDYGHPQGYHQLVGYLDTRLAKEGIMTGEGSGNDVVITSGFQVSLNLLLTLLVRSGEVVAVEDPTFNSILNLLETRRVAHRGVPMEHDGMDVDYLERLIAREKIKVIITIPTLHNPTGTTMSLEKRRRLVTLAQKHNIVIIEDNWAMFLGLDGKREPSLKTLDGGGHVIQIGSFSKSFLPGTRVAWAVLPVGLSASFVRAKRALDRSDSYFLQTLVHEFIAKGYFDLHLRKLDRIYRARLDLMEELMLAHLPAESSWKKPAGGFTCWLNLPDGISGETLLRQSVTQGIDFAPGSFFNVGHKDTGTVRLAFSALTQPQLRQGLRRFGQILNDALGRPNTAGRDAS